MCSIEDEPENETLVQYSAQDLEGENADHIHKTIEALESKLEKSQPNLGVLEEFKRCFREYIGKVEHLKASTKIRDEIKELYDDLRKQRLDTFMSGFSAISQRLKEMYQMITLGGNAELELVDSLDPFSEGILFSVMPPKKSWKNISNLSGGEKVRLKIFANVKRLSRVWHWCLLFITLSRRQFTSWMKLTQRSTLEMCPLLPITSRRERKWLSL